MTSHPLINANNDPPLPYIRHGEFVYNGVVGNTPHSHEPGVMMARFAAKLLAASAALPLAATLVLAPTAAHAEWRGGYGHGGYGHGGYYRGGGYGGAIVGGAILGLGVGALLAAPYYAPPPVVYAPPPVVYAAPPTYAYAPPPAYYAPAPAYAPAPYPYNR